jgi:hypothetical protein
MELGNGVSFACCKGATITKTTHSQIEWATRSNGMRFSKGRTYNSHDTTVTVGSDGRWDVDQTRGVKARCELALHAVLRFGPKGVSAELTSEHINKRVHANYSVSDIRYALNRLVAEGVITSSSGGRGEDAIYRAGKNAQDHWRKLPKEVL